MRRESTTRSVVKISVVCGSGSVVLSEFDAKYFAAAATPVRVSLSYTYLFHILVSYSCFSSCLLEVFVFNVWCNLELCFVVV